MEMKLKEQLNGIQHVGIPTNDIEKTIRFYETLGFEVAFQTVNEGADEKPLQDGETIQFETVAGHTYTVRI